MKTKKKSKVKIIIIVVVVVVVLLGVLFAKVLSSISKTMEAAMEEMQGGNAESLYTVERQDIEQEITTSGNVIGVAQDPYLSPVTAKVKDVYVEVGQTVKKGDVLLTYEDDALGTELEKVQIQAEETRAAGNESYEIVNEASGKASEASKKVKELKEDIKELKKETSKLTKEVQGYEKQIAAVEEASKSKETETDIKSNSTETQDADVQADADSTQDETTQTKEVETPTVNEKAYEKAVSNLSKKNEELAKKEAELAEQEAIVAANEDVKVSESQRVQINAANRLNDMSVNSAQESLDKARAGIKAEHDGIVSAVDILQGTYAQETMTLMTIIPSDQIGVEFDVSKDDLGSISEGQKARIVVADHEYNGKVEFISRVAVMSDGAGNNQAVNQGGTIKGRIVLDNPDDNIFLGVSAKVYIFVGESKQTLCVPYQALNTDINGDFVYVVNGEQLIERKDVTVGIHSDEYYEILSGIEEGDSVILNVTSDMKPGDEFINPDAAMDPAGGLAE